MSINVQNIVFHQIIKQSDTELQLVLRDSDMQINQSVVKLVSDIHTVYEKKQKAYGSFNDESAFSPILIELQNRECNFLKFSIDATKQLRNELAKYPFADSGSVMFCVYSYLAIDYLVIAVLDSRSSMLINENLDITTTQYLDIEHASIMARINLTEWKTDSESIRYLSFIKGRVGRNVSDFFMDFLGANEGMNTRVLNKTLVRAVENYCSEIKLSEQEKQDVRNNVYLYCKAQIDANEEINLAHLSKEIPAGETFNFTTFVDSEEYELDNEFPTDKTIIKSLVTYSGSGGGLTIRFDAGLLGERVKWDPQTDSLVIYGLPPNLRDQLQRNGGN